jgi:gas vesicle protein
MSKEKPDSGGFMAGLVFGAIVGGAMAMFLGGEEGEEVRKNLRQKGKVIFKNLGLLIDETISEGTGVVEESKEEVKKAVEESREEVKKVVDTVKDEGKKSVRRFFFKAGKKLS